MIATQATFRAALLDPDHALPGDLRDGAGRPAGRRFAVYRNNVTVGLAEALAQGFPAVQALLGAGNFGHVARLFLRSHPPTSPVMMLYGAAFPSFLAQQPALARFGYLPDVARLDLALRQSYHAADASPAPAEALAAIPPDTLGAHRLRLAPPVRLVRSAWPVHAIRRRALDDSQPHPDPVAQDVLVTRPEWDPVIRLLPHGGGAVIEALARGATLDTASRDAPGGDLTPFLTVLLQDGCITGLEIPS